MSGPELVTVHDPGTYIQATADKLVPLGWCNACIGQAKKALKSGEQPERIHAAVTTAPTVVVQNAPGIGTMAAVIPLGTCWEHIEGQARASGLVQGMPGAPGL